MGWYTFLYYLVISFTIVDNESSSASDVENVEELPPRKKKKSISGRAVTGAVEQKPRTQADALESGLFAVKDGLVALSAAMVAPPKTTTVVNEGGATLDDVLAAIQAQSAQMTQLLTALVSRNNTQQ